MREVPACLSWLAYFVLKRLRLLQTPDCGKDSIIDAAFAPPVSTLSSMTGISYELVLTEAIEFKMLLLNFSREHQELTFLGEKVEL